MHSGCKRIKRLGGQLSLEEEIRGCDFLEISLRHIQIFTQNLVFFCRAIIIHGKLHRKLYLFPFCKWVFPEQEISRDNRLKRERIM